MNRPLLIASGALTCALISNPVSAQDCALYADAVALELPTRIAKGTPLALGVVGETEDTACDLHIDVRVDGDVRGSFELNSGESSRFAAELEVADDLEVGGHVVEVEVLVLTVKVMVRKIKTKSHLN